jgi:NADPH:quinone reductase-like Zn-dependent oxidoreductase
LGADHVINYRSDPDWHNTVLQLTGGHGADIILETGGAMTLPKSFDCISFGGCIAAVGYLSGKEDPQGERMNMNVLALKRNVTLKGILNGPRDRFEEMLGLYEKERIKPVVDRIFSFADAKEALVYLESSGHFGKVVIQVSE